MNEYMHDISLLLFKWRYFSYKSSDGSGGTGGKPSFLSDLAAKMAAGPPKGPVGLVKKSAVAEQAEEQAKKDLENSQAAQHGLAALLQKSTDSAKNASQSAGEKDKLE